MKNQKVYFRNVFLRVMLIVLFATLSACDGSDNVPNNAFGTQSAVSQALPSSPDEAQQIEKAIDLDQAAGQARWDQELQEANSDLHNPFNNRGRVDNPPPHRDPPRNQEDGVVVQGGNSGQEVREPILECANQTGTKWSRNTCVCNEEEGYWNFGNGRLVCEKRVSAILLNIGVPDRGDGGTDANLRFTICYKTSPANLTALCKSFVVSSSGNFLERNTVTTLYLELNTLIPVGGLTSVSLINVDDAGEKPSWLMESVQVSFLPSDNARRVNEDQLRLTMGASHLPRFTPLYNNAHENQTINTEESFLLELLIGST